MNRPDAAAPNLTRRTKSGSPLGLLLGGLVAVVGSFLTWGSCPDSACGAEGIAFFSFVYFSGLALGPGVITAFLGLFLAIGGVVALRGAVVPAFRSELVIVAIALLGTVGAFLVRMYVFPDFLFPEFLKYDPELGAFVVVVGGVIALAGSLRLRAGDAAFRST